jgi:hypothetical protein
VRVIAAPVRLLVDQSGVGECGEQLVEVPVHVTDDKGRRILFLHTATIIQSEFTRRAIGTYWPPNGSSAFPTRSATDSITRVGR